MATGRTAGSWASSPTHSEGGAGPVAHDVEHGAGTGLLTDPPGQPAVGDVAGPVDGVRHRDQDQVGVRDPQRPDADGEHRADERDEVGPGAQGAGARSRRGGRGRGRWWSCRPRCAPGGRPPEPPGVPSGGPAGTAGRARRAADPVPGYRIPPSGAGPGGAVSTQTGRVGRLRDRLGATTCLRLAGAARAVRRRRRRGAGLRGRCRWRCESDTVDALGQRGRHRRRGGLACRAGRLRSTVLAVVAGFVALFVPDSIFLWPVVSRRWCSPRSPRTWRSSVARLGGRSRRLARLGARRPAGPQRRPLPRGAARRRASGYLLRSRLRANELARVTEELRGQALLARAAPEPGPRAARHRRAPRHRHGGDGRGRPVRRPARGAARDRRAGPSGPRRSSTPSSSTCATPARQLVVTRPAPAGRHRRAARRAAARPGRRGRRARRPRPGARRARRARGVPDRAGGPHQRHPARRRRPRVGGGPADGGAGPGPGQRRRRRAAARAPVRGAGLVGIGERVAGLGGTWQVASGPGGGTSWTSGCRSRDPGRGRRRPAAGARRLRDDPGGPARRRGRRPRRGRPAVPGRGARRPPPRRRAGRHPDARAWTACRRPGPWPACPMRRR